MIQKANYKFVPYIHANSEQYLFSVLSLSLFLSHCHISLKCSLFLYIKSVLHLFCEQIIILAAFALLLINVSGNTIQI
jgi:hypothetical protein